MKANVILVGGMAGAGKKCSMSRLARWLLRRKHRIMLVTDSLESVSDEPENLTGARRLKGVPQAGLCCRPDILERTVGVLKDRLRPDTIIIDSGERGDGEITAVVRPLRMLYTALKFAPLSVVVDSYDAFHALGLQPGRGFPSHIRDAVHRQMERAEIIVLNKRDVIPTRDRQLLHDEVRRRFPRASVYSISARSGECCRGWFDALVRKTSGYRLIPEEDAESFAQDAVLGIRLRLKTQVGEDDFFHNREA